jgi:beta-lactam-binding protein with PASTA domain
LEGLGFTGPHWQVQEASEDSRMTLGAAKRALAHVNCLLGKVSRACSKVKAGLVLAQKPGSAPVRPKGGTVDLVVSRGPNG